MARTIDAQRAAVIVVHPLVVDLWCRLARQPAAVDLGVESFDHRDHHRVTRQAVKRLQSFGYQVTLTSAS